MKHDAPISRQYRGKANLLDWLLLEMLHRAPLGGAAACLRALGRWSFRLQGRRRRRAVELMRGMLPADCPPGRVIRLAESQAVNDTMIFHLSFLLMRRDPRRCAQRVDVRGWEHVQRALTAGRGAVLLSSHVGFPRLLQWHLRLRDSPAIHLLNIRHSRPARPSFHRWLHQRLRRRFGVEDDVLAGDDPLAVRYMKKAYDGLRRNHLVNIAADGNLGDRRMPTTILGRPMSFAVGGLSLGLLSGAAILPCFCAIHPEPRFIIEFQPPLSAPADQPRDQQLACLLAAYSARLEAFIRLHPDQVMRERYLVAPAPPPESGHG
jgi:KDO2-lipid IV(A) lauroyltransferase